MRQPYLPSRTHMHWMPAQSSKLSSSTEYMIDGRVVECCTTDLQGSVLWLCTVCDVSDDSSNMSRETVAMTPSLEIM